MVRDRPQLAQPPGLPGPLPRAYRQFVGPNFKAHSGRIFAIRPSLADRQLHTKYRTFFAIGSHVLGRCRPKPDRRLTVAKTATLSQLKHLLRSGRIAYRSISSSSRSSSRPVNPMIVPSLAPFDRRGENSRRRNARRIFVKARSSRGACRATTPQVHPGLIGH
jgi:hypothetical protein